MLNLWIIEAIKQKELEEQPQIPLEEWPEMPIPEPEPKTEDRGVIIIDNP